MKGPCLAAACLLAATGVWGATDAEFAIRWDPAEGGPGTIAAIAETLELPMGAPKLYSVRYFVAKRPDKASPGGTAPIIRERVSGGEVESTYKLRVPAASEAARGMRPDGRCPFLVSAKWANEVDVGWGAEGVLKSTSSSSCTVRGRVADLLPDHFEASPLGCPSSMERMNSAGLKVERWDLPSGRQALEVSAKGKNTDAQRKEFVRRVVRPLLAHGIKPLDQSKSQLGSSC
jgi:hypothetical protein